MNTLTDEATVPRRLRAADVIDAQQRIIEQLTQRSSEPYVTVEFTRNAKGDTQISTKVSAPTSVTQDDLARLSDRVLIAAKAIYDDAAKSYPGPRTNGETK